MQGSEQINRRRFLKSAAAAVTFPSIIPSSARGGGARPPASERIVVGIIGCGFGWEMFAGGGPMQCVAVCDVRKTTRELVKAEADRRQGNKDCATYNDFRELLARDDIDAVYIATPDHWHALITIAAAKAGKDIYCQKPLTRAFTESKAVREAVQRSGVVFQHGAQQRSDPRMVRGCEMVRNGRIGQLRNVRLGIPGGEAVGPQPIEPVPPELDYDMWLGPAPWAPYTTRRCTSVGHSWYFISDYCIGHLSGWGVHHIDSAQQGTGADHTGPLEIEGRAQFPQEGLYDTAVTWKIKYTFADGVTWDCTDDSQNRMGILFEGAEGWVFIWRGVLDAHPKSLLKEAIRPEEARLYRSNDHVRNFLDCVKSRGRTAAPVDVAHRSTTLCCLGDIATRLGRKIRWDPEAECFHDDPAATRLLSRAYRAPWTLSV
ncbi:MAG: Gfo/Idh/MocA family oxidoreductase [Candidatus Sumerlaeota bacterium]|nr:Gfo/Idh/MocA family oxidoreductase [Candidatus Sumerlaeota bacterium]